MVPNEPLRLSWGHSWELRKPSAGSCGLLKASCRLGPAAAPEFPWSYRGGPLPPLELPLLAHGTASPAQETNSSSWGD